MQCGGATRSADSRLRVHSSLAHQCVHCLSPPRSCPQRSRRSAEHSLSPLHSAANRVQLHRTAVALRAMSSKRRKVTAEEGATATSFTLRIQRNAAAAEEEEEVEEAEEEEAADGDDGDYNPDASASSSRSSKAARGGRRGRGARAAAAADDDGDDVVFLDTAAARASNRQAAATAASFDDDEEVYVDVLDDTEDHKSKETRAQRWAVAQ